MTSLYLSALSFSRFIAHLLAGCGGAILMLLVGLNVLSIMGRAFVPLDVGIGPIRGIYDITELGMAAAIFAFLPLAQLNDAHARVDLIKSVFPELINRCLELLCAVVMCGIASIGCWRLAVGMADKFSYGETTQIAQIPIWTGYAAGLVGASGFVLVSLFCIWRSALRLAGQEPEEGAAYDTD